MTHNSPQVDTRTHRQGDSEGATGTVRKWIREFLFYGPNRQEHPDPTPVEVPITQGLLSSVNSLSELRRLMKIVSMEAEREGKETFEEANDFGSDEEFDDALAPAQLRAQAVDMAIDLQFEQKPKEKAPPAPLDPDETDPPGKPKAKAPAKD